MKLGVLSTLNDILRQRCPRCRVGTIFQTSMYLGFPKMLDRCPVCHLLYNREPGYFMGAMYISYGLGLLIIAVFAALLWAITGMWITKDFIWAIVLFLPLAPAITFLSRVLWIYFDQTFDPDRR
jgi:uncharacterized protein (DUF983 family)